MIVLIYYYYYYFSSFFFSFLPFVDPQTRPILGLGTSGIPMRMLLLSNRVTGTDRPGCSIKRPTITTASPFPRFIRLEPALLRLHLFSPPPASFFDFILVAHPEVCDFFFFFFF